VPRDATDDDIRKQYRKLAVLIHPDKVLVWLYVFPGAMVKTIKNNNNAFQ